MPNLEGQVAIITGASRGIGAECARSLAAAGATVALAARTESDLDKLEADLAPKAASYLCDLSDPASAATLVERVAADFGRVDIVVNNAGRTLTKPVAKIEQSDIEAVLALNVTSPMLVCAAAAAVMVEHGGGSIINISTVASCTGIPYMGVYAASKAALDAFAKSAAAELGPSGIRVNNVAPGLIVTDMWEQGRAIPGLADRLEQAVALRRWGTPGDIADVVTFLASDEARYVTGQTLIVDGGFANMVELLPRH